MTNYLCYSKKCFVSSTRQRSTFTWKHSLHCSLPLVAFWQHLSHSLVPSLFLHTKQNYTPNMPNVTNLSYLKARYRYYCFSLTHSLLPLLVSKPFPVPNQPNADWSTWYIGALVHNRKEVAFFSWFLCFACKQIMLASGVLRNHSFYHFFLH